MNRKQLYESMGEIDETVLDAANRTSAPRQSGACPAGLAFWRRYWPWSWWAWPC